jgi:hypothetical protein
MHRKYHKLCSLHICRAINSCLCPCTVLVRLTHILTYLQAPEQEYPPAFLSSSFSPLQIGTWSSTSTNSWYTQLSGQLYGNGAYRIAASGGHAQTAYPQWFVFESEGQSVGGHWKEFNYADGVFTAGALPMYTLDGSYYGDWMYIQMPDPIVVTACTFTARSSNTARVPGKFRIYGSNDGSTWALVHDQTTLLSYTSNKGTVTIAGASAYSYIALVVSSLLPGGNTLNFVKWKIMGMVCMCARVLVLVMSMYAPG